MFKAKINVTLKESVLDPQGKAILNAFHSLGFIETQDVRAGKYFEVLINSVDRNQAEQKIRQGCEKLLVNPVIEKYSFELEEK